MRPVGTKHELELRRREAVALWERGLSMREVARLVGCAPASVSRWAKAYRERGAGGLDPLPQGGSPARLSAKQRQRLGRWIIAGPRRAGYPNDLWTLSRVQRLIEDRFEVRYHISHVHRLLLSLGFSAQKPARLAREREDRAVQEFRRKRWPAIKKKPAKRDGRSS